MKNFIEQLHPKVTAAGLVGGAVLVVQGICMALGVPAPGWLSAAAPIAIALLAAWLKKAA